MGTNPEHRLQTLENIEKELAAALQSAGQALLELSKDKPNMKTVEGNSSSFLKTLESVEQGLAKQISYLTQVSTGQPHEGSSYAAQKDLQMALHRLEHVRSRLAELERMKNEHLRSRSQFSQRTMASSDMGSFQRTLSQGDALASFQRSFSTGETVPSVHRNASQDHH